MFLHREQRSENRDYVNMVPALLLGKSGEIQAVLRNPVAVQGVILWQQGGETCSI
jgi:hypothetical protein